MKRHLRALSGAAAGLLACSLPATAVRTGAARPSLALRGAPPDAVLVLDGREVGAAARYDGDAGVLVVEPGTHLVELRDGLGKVRFRQRVFVESELKTVEVH
jgi:hypothetical protein